MSEFSLIISCEHAGNQLPVRYRTTLENEGVLDSAAGWDEGAMDIAVSLAESMNVPCFTHLTTRLLVDVNSSLTHPDLFSTFSQHLGDEEKQLLLDKYYFPYRLRVERAITLASKPLVHLSIHTFSEDELNKEEILILSKREREFEYTVASKIKMELERTCTWLAVFEKECLQNQVGFIDYLRSRFEKEEYAGIEIHIPKKTAVGNEVDKLLMAIREGLLSS